MCLCLGACGSSEGAADSPGGGATGHGASFTGACSAGTRQGPLAPGDLGGYGSVPAVAPDRLQAVSAPARSPGRCVVRIEVHPGDGGDDQTDRIEYTAPHTLWSNGDNVWYAMSFMLDRKSPPVPAHGWMLVHQFFAQDIPAGVSGGSPPLAVEVSAKRTILVDVRGGAKPDPGASAPRDDSYYLARSRAGVWQDVLLHVRWSTGANGLVQAWFRRAGRPFRKAPQISVAGANVLTVAGHPLPVYAETGVYRRRDAATQVVYQAGLWARPTRAAAERFFGSSGHRK